MSRGQEEMEGLKTQCTESGCRIQSLQAETESIRALVSTAPRGAPTRNTQYTQYRQSTRAVQATTHLWR